MPTSAIVALANITLGSTASSVSFGSIPATYRDLRLVVQATTSGANAAGFTLNGDATNGNYSWVQIFGDGSSAVSNSGTGASGILPFTPNQNFSTTVASIVTLDVMDYSAVNKHKSMLYRTNRADAVTNAIAARWANTAAVTTLTVSAISVNFAIGSTFSLFAIVS